MTGIWTPPNNLSLINQKDPFAGTPTPVFWVPFTDTGNGVCNINPVIAYGSTSFFLSTSPIWTRLASGLWKEVPAGSPPSYYGCIYDQPFAGRYDGLLLQGAKTNICLYARDGTQANWVKVNITATKDIQGIDGADNSATRLTATANNGTIIQAIGSGSQWCSIFLRRISGTGTVSITTNNGGNWTDITSRLTVHGTNWSSGPFFQFMVGASGFGIRIGTSGDVIGMDMGQAEGNSPAGVTVPIPTTNVSVTRNAQFINYNLLSRILGNNRTWTIGVRDVTQPFSNVADAAYMESYIDANNRFQLAMIGTVPNKLIIRNNSVSGDIDPIAFGAITAGDPYNVWATSDAVVGNRAMIADQIPPAAAIPYRDGINSASSTLELGNAQGGTFYGGCTLKNLLAYNVALDQDALVNVQLPVFPYNT